MDLNRLSNEELLQLVRRKRVELMDNRQKFLKVSPRLQGMLNMEADRISKEIIQIEEEGRNRGIELR